MEIPKTGAIFRRTVNGACIGPLTVIVPSGWGMAMTTSGYRAGRIRAVGGHRLAGNVPKEGGDGEMSSSVVRLPISKPWTAPTPIPLLARIFNKLQTVYRQIRTVTVGYRQVAK